MKFGQELEEHAVREWSPKYLDYKRAKKKLKALTKAIRSIDRSSQTFLRRPPDHKSPHSSLRDGPVRTLFMRTADQGHAEAQVRNPTQDSSPGDPNITRTGRAVARDIAAHVTETSPINAVQAPRDKPRMTRYGSIIGSPDNAGMAYLQPAPSLELPHPALDEDGGKADSSGERTIQPQERLPLSRRSTAHAPTAQSNSTGLLRQTKPESVPPSAHSRTPLYRTASLPQDTPPFLTRFLKSRTGTFNGTSVDEGIALDNYREVDAKKADFTDFLEEELDKIEDFYLLKESEATERLRILREQLHIMRNYRLEELVSLDHHHHHHGTEEGPEVAKHRESSNPTSNHSLASKFAAPGTLFATIDHAQHRIADTLAHIRSGPVGKTSEAMRKLSTPPFTGNWQSVNNDYERRPTAAKDVPYRTAKRKLKIALAEYYRGLELLKSYTLLNRTAFRKINKKYDKLVRPQKLMGFVDENVNGAYFVTSEVLDSHIRAVEDLYARYFERGNHKVAVGKLRAKTAKAGDYNASTFRTGCLVMGGTIFAIQGLVYALQQELADPSAIVRSHAAFLLQLYAGYFLILLMMAFFCADASFFAREKVNYQFIFEFDTRHMLDWKQVCEIPALLYFLLGVIMWLNFSRFAGDDMYIYWPVVLIGIAAILLFLPLPVLYHRSRLWFLYTCWRLLCSGFYPVEFRDFFTGDIFCSLTYAVGNIPLFFCLYAGHWDSPGVCTSSQSRLFGFFTALPGIWRLLQCVRRYFNTGDWFPHAANGGKYAFTIMFYASLSAYRIDHSYPFKAFFIFAAAVNAIYCSVWDLIMDWSFTLNPTVHPPLLREVQGLRSGLWLYYTAIVIDPIIRFNWILYAIFTENTQHSTIVSFVVALSEVFRRGLWVLFRIENEHCTNITKFRAHRDVPLPYVIGRRNSQTSLLSRSETQTRQLSAATLRGPQISQGALGAAASPSSPADQRETTNSTQSSAVDVEQGMSPATASLRQRRSTFVSADSPVARALKRVGTTMLTAHAKDYERKKPVPEQEARTNAESDDEDDDDDDVDDIGAEVSNHH